MTNKELGALLQTIEHPIQRVTAECDSKGVSTVTIVTANITTVWNYDAARAESWSILTRAEFTSKTTTITVFND